MVAVFVLVAADGGLTVTSTNSAQGDFQKRVGEIEKRMAGRMGVAALDSGSGNRLDYRSEERFPMCSTFKFLAVAAVLKRVAAAIAQ